MRKTDSLASVYDESINQFLARAISAQPTPGGVSTAALAAALAAGMVGMTASLTLGKKAYSLYQEAAAEVLRQAQELTDRLKDLTIQDMEAYQDYIAAFRLPKGSREEAAAREQAVQQAGRRVTEIPLSICQACLEVIAQAHAIADFGNRMAIADAGVGAHLAWGALQAAMLNVRLNLASVQDQSFIALAQIRQQELLDEGQRLSRETAAKIEQRCAKNPAIFCEIKQPSGG
jgi:formiminotetrahydrofolate cyclodeaminase